MCAFKNIRLFNVHSHRFDLRRLRSKIDVLLFNPPYVVTPAEEVADGGLTASWAGGDRGRQVTDRLLPVVSDFLSRPGGLFYLVTIPENDPEEICDILRLRGLVGDVVLRRRAGPENLAIYRFSFGGSEAGGEGGGGGGATAAAAAE